MLVQIKRIYLVKKNTRALSIIVEIVCSIKYVKAKYKYSNM